MELKYTGHFDEVVNTDGSITAFSETSANGYIISILGLCRSTHSHMVFNSDNGVGQTSATFNLMTDRTSKL